MSTALREALTLARHKLRLYRARSDGEYVGGMEYMALMEFIDKALAERPTYNVPPWLQGALDLVERIAFEMPAPNQYTPRLMQLVAEARSRLVNDQTAHERTPRREGKSFNLDVERCGNCNRPRTECRREPCYIGAQVEDIG